ncbi:hypothetical protein Poly30_06710 [Planctomycetes bacterium Poly30]|uniref:Uncharacterized protein n=1 Tax=Saltatorellus ferox TaxID=2528018 RepID=A0A518EM56_9BACT|nr:hypothetical protein Poly30_06710 [Planctomycetes bacterium Poly30]
MQAPLITALAASLSLGATHSDDTVKLQLAPTSGTVSTYAVEILRTIQGGDLQVVMNGNEVPAQFLPKLEFEFTASTTATVTDHFLPGENDITGPWRKRTLEDLTSAFDMSLTYSGETTDFAAEASSPLDDQPFLLGLDEDGEVVARWADPESKLDDEFLARVRPELHLEGLLPDEPVAMGATWEADASAVAAILDFSESLPWNWPSDAAENVPGPASNTYEGTLELTVIDLRTEDETVFCTVSLSGDIVETGTRATDLAQVPVADGTATETTTTTFTVEGELVWNVTAAHLASFELKGEGEGEQATVKDPGQPGPDYSSTTRHKAQLEIQVK